MPPKFSQTFKLHSHSTSSAFDPHIIDESKYSMNQNNNDELSNYNKARSSGPVFSFDDDTVIYFIPVKWSHISEGFTSLYFPLRDLYIINNIENKIKGQLAFYILNNNAAYIRGSIYNFQIDNSKVDSDYIIINFPENVLPPINSLGVNIPIYVGIKLINLPPTNSFTTNSQYFNDDNVDFYNNYGFTFKKNNILQSTGMDTIYVFNQDITINYMKLIPELYLE